MYIYRRYYRYSNKAYYLGKDGGKDPPRRAGGGQAAAGTGRDTPAAVGRSADLEYSNIVKLRPR